MRKPGNDAPDAVVAAILLIIARVLVNLLQEMPLLSVVFSTPEKALVPLFADAQRSAHGRYRLTSQVSADEVVFAAGSYALGCMTKKYSAS